MVGQLHRRGAAGIGDRNHHIDIVIRALAQDLLRQLYAHAQARLVDVDIVDDRVL